MVNSTTVHRFLDGTYVVEITLQCVRTLNTIIQKIFSQECTVICILICSTIFLWPKVTTFLTVGRSKSDRILPYLVSVKNV